MNYWGKFTIAVGLFFSTSLLAGPEEDRKAFQQYFIDTFPSVSMDEFINGIYAINQELREQWESIEELPPYEIAVDEGEALVTQPFKNGKNIASCFKNSGVGVAANYPYFDVSRNQVVTLALDINDCLTRNDEPELEYKQGRMASILAYFASVSRGLPIELENPAKNPGALQAYKKGKQFYYARRGQFNMSCAHCHIDQAGKKLRANLLGPGLGQITHFPVYRSKWGNVGTLHRRIIGCMLQMRAEPFAAQSEEYRNLEYFMTYMSNGLTWNGPGSRF
ncbi:MAG: sulfur oxidation c-type cytochrome SoxA [Gammaproteobacteria bacterium]|nr:sulfur oxidation c-type cytochrome SoxA [Gammaproteobacteria bacterium]MDH5800036.1 sulfur oxidation c-type cytochrome SoxA [Gammaproteobacteria bacterium]